jgi:Dolichyl-phosphate-mannose-protein mannosyltransferase
MNMRGFFLAAVVLIGAATVLVTEVLSAFTLIRPAALAVFWILVAGFTVRAIRLRKPKTEPFVVLSVGAIAAILVITATTAAFSPPNSTDAMAYHLPRVIYWAEQSSVRFFPTQYLTQISLQPMAEYFMLHSYLLSGGDHLINFVQWFASLASIVGVSSIAGLLGATLRGEAVAAIFCATLPSGILASSGAKNDYVLAMWLVSATYFALRYRQSGLIAEGALLGLALGLALFTKATGYLFAPWILAAILLPILRTRAKGLLIVAACALAVNAPQYARNLALSGSPMGFDSAQGDGFFRWRNDTLGPKQTISNIARNLSEQLGARSESWNHGVYGAVIAIHRRLGIDPNDPATTWRWTSFAPPRNSNHEADAPNRWHLMILVVLFFVSLGSRGHRRDRTLYALSLVCGFVAFCVYLKWQPFLARLFLPLFVLASPLAAAVEEIPGPTWLIQAALTLFLVTAARPALFENWVRPLKGPKSILRVARDDQYFSDMTQWNNAASYKQAAEQLAGSGCGTVGVDSVNLHIEYPLQALLRERNPAVRFVHTGVTNQSARYLQPIESIPCAVVCLDCADDTTRLELYRNFPESSKTGKFVIFYRKHP